MMEEILKRLKDVQTMPHLDAMRTEVAAAMIGHGEETFHEIQDAFRAAKNRLRRVPLSERSW